MLNENASKDHDITSKSINYHKMSREKTMPLIMHMVESHRYIYILIL